MSARFDPRIEDATDELLANIDRQLDELTYQLGLGLPRGLETLTCATKSILHDLCIIEPDPSTYIKHLKLIKKCYVFYTKVDRFG